MRPPKAWARAVQQLPTMGEVSAARRAPAKPSRWDRKADRRAERREQATARDKFRTGIFVKDMGKCRCCQRRVWLKVADAPHELAVGHVHEWVKRSQGGSEVDPLNCLLLCAACHDRYGNHDNIVPCDPVKLMRGEVAFVDAS